MLAKQLQSVAFTKIKKIDIGSLSADQKQKALKFSNDRFNAMDSYVRDTIEKSQSFYNIEKYTLDAITAQLKQTEHQLQEKKVINRRMLDELVIEEKEAAQQLIALQQHKPVHREEDLRKTINEIKQQIVSLNKERQGIADNLQVMNLSTLTMKNKDQDALVNELFKWTLLFFYKDPVSNYYWPNFKQEAFGNDKGEDFRQRCAKIKAVDLKKDEVVKTEMILSMKAQILADPLLNHDQQAVVAQMFKIMELILLINEKGHLIRDAEGSQTEQLNTNTRVSTDLERTHTRIQLLKDRVVFQNHIFYVLDKLHKEVQSKLYSYEQAQKLNVKFIAQLQQEYKEIDLTKHYQAVYVHDDTKMEQKQTDIIVEVERVVKDEEDNYYQVNQTKKGVEVNYVYEDNPQLVANDRTEIGMEKREGGCDGCKIF